MDTVVNSVVGLRLTRTDLIVYGIISFLVVLWYRYKWNRRPYEGLAKKLKGPPTYPIIGSALYFVGTSQQIMEKIIHLGEVYGPDPFEVSVASDFGVAISRPEDLQIILNHSKALDKGKYYKFLRKGIGEGLVAAPVEKWKRHRRIISPVFNVNLFDHFLPVFIQKYQILIRVLNKKVGETQPFDLWDYIANANLDIICQTSMGYNLNIQSNVNSEFAKSIVKGLEEFIKRLLSPWLHPDLLYSIYEKLTGLTKVYNTLHTLPNQVIKEKKEEYANKKKRQDLNDIDDTNNEKKVFLDTLLELNEAGAIFTNNEIKDEIVTMMGAGSDTTAITICFCLLMIAIHQDVQDKVYDEIYEVLGDSDEPITINEINKLIYMEQVIKETLRLFPVIPVIIRQIQDDVKIYSNDFILPKGTMCYLGVILTHRIPDIYQNPWMFNPDNFSPENVAKRHKYSYLPFSGGPRNCIGYKYAMLSIKVLLSMFLQNFSVHSEVKLSDIKLIMIGIIRSINGFPVTIRLRDRRPTYKRKEKN